MDGVTLLLFSVIVNHVPGCGAIISGDTTVCAGTSNITYSVSPIANATSYIWTLPAGATGTSSTNSITVNFSGVALSGDIVVQGNSAYGVGAHSSIHITVDPCTGVSDLNDRKEDLKIIYDPIDHFIQLSFSNPLKNFETKITDIFSGSVY